MQHHDGNQMTDPSYIDVSDVPSQVRKVPEEDSIRVSRFPFLKYVRYPSYVCSNGLTWIFMLLFRGCSRRPLYKPMSSIFYFEDLELPRILAFFDGLL